MKKEAWTRALERFEGGYGEPFDATDPWAVRELLAMLECEVRADVEAAIAEQFRAAAQRVLSATDGPTPLRAA